MCVQMNPKLKAAKFAYEYLGLTAEDISEQYGFMAIMIQKEIENGRWSRKVDMPELPTTRDLSSFASALEQQARDRLKVIALYKQIEHLPLITHIETAVLEKIREAVETLDTEDPYAASKLTNLVNAVNSLRQNDPIATAENSKLNGGDGNVIVNIQNNVQ